MSYLEDKYYEEHKYCPICGGEHYRMTLKGFIFNESHPEKFKDDNFIECIECGYKGIKHDCIANPEDCEGFYITEGMRERKAQLDKISDAVITLAGGYGTLEEISEMIVQKQLGYNNKPLVILNTNHFYDHLLAFFEETIIQRFAIPESKSLYYVTDSVKDAINYIKTYVPPLEQHSKYAAK
jgi:uncharacterized protein (TIGR00730 family)